MPFTRITSGPDKGKYRSPSGKVWTKEEMEAYLARKHAGKKEGRKA